MSSHQILKLYKILGLCVVSMHSVMLAAQEKRILFVGNSYVAVNNLPQMVKDVAASTGDLLTVDSHTPGGQTFQMHAGNTTTLNKIAIGNWDFVVLQEQSQLPAFPENQVITNVYPFATQLNNLIVQSNPCAETVFYMTWGRKNGDASNCEFWPPICTYEGMDNLLYERYMAMAQQNDAIVSPVGAVWKYLRQNHPTIELYNADQSHPSVAGTYAAACTFYTTILRKDPMQISYNSSLSQADADIIRAAAKTVVFDALSDWFIGTYDPAADFTHDVTGATVSFTPNVANDQTYLWDFGDGNTSTDPQPQHTYTASANYTVTLTVSHCGQTDSDSQTVDITTLNVKQNNADLEFICYPTIVSDKIQIQTTKMISHVYLIDMTGRVVDLPFSSEKNSTAIDLSAFSSAIYFVKVLTDSKSFTAKIVKH